MKKGLKRIALGTLLIVAGGTVPIVPQDMTLIKSYGYPFDQQAAVMLIEKQTGIDADQPAFTDDDGNNFISISKFEDAKGNIVYQQISDQLYDDMTKPKGSLPGGKGGYNSNPTYTELVSVGSLFIQSAHAAVARDTTSNSSTAGTSLTYSHTVTGTNMAITTQIWDQGTNGSITTMTYNGTNETSMDSVTCPNNGVGRKLYIYAQLAPTSGANNVSIVRSVSAGGAMNSTSASYSGVSQSGLPDAHNTGTGSLNDGSLAVSVTRVASNPGLIATCVNNQVACGAGTNTATPAFVSNGDVQTFESNPFPTSGTGSFTMNFTGTGSGVLDSECAVVVSLAPAASAVVPTVNTPLIF